MDIFEILALIVALSAVFRYLNDRWLHLPPTVALMLMSLSVAGALLVFTQLTGAGQPVESHLRTWVEQLQFSRTLLQSLLGFLLFAGALKLDLEGFSIRWPVAFLATVGTLVSALIVGSTSFALLRVVGVPMSFPYCMLFGALISPTDPISVSHVFRRVGASRDLETTIAGESLFNDGVGVVLFTVVLETIGAGESGGLPGPAEVLTLFAREVIGGLAIGVALGWLAFLMLRRIDSYQTEVLVTLAVVMGGYSLCQPIGASGPLSTVAAGILIGSRVRKEAMSERTRIHLDTFWELVDEFLNAFLFVAIGLEMLVIPFDVNRITAGAVLIPVVLVARLMTAGLPLGGMRQRYGLPRHTWLLLTWGGLKGLISVAMALSIPPSRERALIVTVTYVIVVFSVIVQGVTLHRLVRRTYDG